MNVAARRPLDELFTALADATRRDLLQSLVHHGPRTATEFATDATITRQGIVKHLKALEDAGLVAAERTGREVKYRATTERLAEAVSWLLDAGETWDRRTARLAGRNHGSDEILVPVVATLNSMRSSRRLPSNRNED